MSANTTIGTYSNSILKLSLQKHIEMKENLPNFKLFNGCLFSNLQKNFRIQNEIGGSDHTSNCITLLHMLGIGKNHLPNNLEKGRISHCVSSDV